MPEGEGGGLVPLSVAFRRHVFVKRLVEYKRGSSHSEGILSLAQQLTSLFASEQSPFSTERYWTRAERRVRSR